MDFSSHGRSSTGNALLLVRSHVALRLKTFEKQTTVTQAEMRGATEAVKAVVSMVNHGKVMFNLDGQVRESVESLQENSIC